MNPQERVINLGPLEVRALITPKSIDPEARTVEMVFATGAPVQRQDFWTGDRYIEKLSMDPAHVRLDRLNAGAPLLDTHRGGSLSSMLGSIVPGSAKVVAKEGRAVVQFSRRAEVEPIFQDVRDGVISNVSVGYRVYLYEEKTGKAGQLPIRTAVDWEPVEVSMVPMPADVGAKVREAGASEFAPCVVRTISEERQTMANERQPSEFVAEDPLAAGLAAPAAPAAPPAAPVVRNDADIAAEGERDRVLGIMVAVRAARLPQTRADEYVRSGKPLVAIQGEIFEELNRREVAVPANTPSGVQISGPDPLMHARAGIENAILHRTNPQTFKLDDRGREYRGMTLLDIGRVYLHAQGVRTSAMSKMELAGLALGLNVRAGMHTTSDYANLLADVAGKSLRAAYDAAPQTFTIIGRRVTLPDFKPVKRLQLGEAPALTEVTEAGEYTRGTIGEGKEQFQLATYGRVFAITRKTLINDDTDAFSRVPSLFGRAARNLESNLAWEQITSNPTMGDTIALFHASHGNLAADGDPISIDTLAAGRSAMRLQTGLDSDGVTYLNITPKYLLVPTTLETKADQFLATITPATAGNANPFSGRLQVVAEPRLDAASTIAWYLAASPDQIDMLEYAYLEGEDGPAVESRIGFDVDGLEIKCRHDFAAKVIDYRGFYRNDGDQES